MKKILLLGILALGFYSENVSGQCTPDPAHTTELVYPLPAGANYTAYEGQNFEEVITINVPKDTSVVVGGFPITAIIDSVVLTSITGLPPGLVSLCNPGNCSFKGNTSGCVVIGGVPTTQGTYSVKPKIKGYYSALGSQTSFTIDTLSYTIKVEKPNSVNELNASDKLQLINNPIEENLNINFKSSSNGNAEFSVYNILGELVLNQKKALNRGDNQLTLKVSHLVSGQYILVMKMGEKVISKNFNKL